MLCDLDDDGMPIHNGHPDSASDSDVEDSYLPRPGIVEPTFPVNPDEDWVKISDVAERRTVQNRIRQRSFRYRELNREYNSNLTKQYEEYSGAIRRSGRMSQHKFSIPKAQERGIYWDAWNTTVSFLPERVGRYSMFSTPALVSACSPRNLKRKPSKPESTIYATMLLQLSPYQVWQ